VKNCPGRRQKQILSHDLNKARKLRDETPSFHLAMPPPLGYVHPASMKKWLLLSLLILLLPPSMKAQFGGVGGPALGEIPVDINSDETSFENGIAVAQGNVEISYKTTTIYCDYAQYDRDTGDTLVKGNVRIYTDGHLFVGERAVYNFNTKELRSVNFHGDFYPFKFAADSFSSIGPNAYQGNNAILTTSDSSKPDYYLKARTVRIYPHDRAVFSDVTLYVGKTPVFWFPYMYQSLEKDAGFVIRPGYESLWGAYVLTEYSFPISANLYGKFHLDLRSRRGPATGIDFNYKDKSKDGKDDQSWGKFISYYIKDSNPEVNDTAFARGDIPTNRYRITLQGRDYLTDDLYLTVNINKLSDALYLQDFSPGEFLIDPQPDNVIALTKWDENYTVTGIVRDQLNNFFQATERLPELDLDVTRKSLLGTGIFYEGDASVSRLSENFQSGAPTPDYSTTRIDSFIQFLYPKTYFGWLTFTPRVGVEGTYYSSSGDSGPTVFNEGSTSGQLVIPTTQAVTTSQPLVKEGALFRPVITAGFEASFKLSKDLDDVETREWGFDGLRHVLQPYTDFSYVHTGQNPNNILQFDNLNPSTQLAPLDLSNFNSTDAITDWTIWRLGARNRLETRRDDDVYDWLELDSFVDINLQEPQYPGLIYRQGTFSNFFNNIKWSPLPWFFTQVDSQVPLSHKGFSEINTAFNFLPSSNLKFSVGDNYINDNPYFVDSNLITFGTYLRLNDNWALSVSEQYELHTHQLQYETYEVHRDLSSWTAAFGIYVRNNEVTGAGGSIDYGVTLTFTLKDFPSISSPVSIGTPGQ
jgi:lipopolysaccharide assembly outer membrane protein LptD (OstA)